MDTDDAWRTGVHVHAPEAARISCRDDEDDNGVTDAQSLAFRNRSRPETHPGGVPTRDRTCSLGEIEEPIDGLTLDLGLTLDDDPTMNGREVPLRNRHGEARGDVRSVYEVGREADERQIRNRSC